MPTVAGRFDLDDRLAQGAGAEYWHGRDTTLGRDIGVLLLPGGHPRAAAVLAAARRAAALPDAGFVRVLDAARDGDTTYIVSQWIRGTDVAALIAGGPLDPDDAIRIVTSAADSMAIAHAAGLPHLHLQPRSLLRAENGEVRVVGIGLDAALRGTAVTDPRQAARVDTRALGSMLYEMLTGERMSVAAGLSPQRRRPDVDDDLDEVVLRSLGADLAGGPLDSPAALAAALRGLAPVAEEVTVVPRRAPEPARSRLAAILLAGLAVLGVGLIGWLLATAGLPSLSSEEAAPGIPVVPTPGAGSPVGESPPPSAPPDTGPVVTVATAEDFDPEGNGQENTALVAQAIDGDLTTAWRTVTYRTEDLGGLKSGVGLLLDLGGVQQVQSVAIDLGIGPTALELRAAESRGEQADDYRVIASSDSATGRADLVLPRPVEARFLLVWLTRLPTQSDGLYRGEVAEITVTRT
jgi:hypothetical protein